MHRRGSRRLPEGRGDRTCRGGGTRRGAELWGGKPDEVDVKARVMAQGFSAEDVLGFHVLRTISQWVRKRRVENAGDSRLQFLVEEELRRARGALELPGTVLPGFERWADWYQALNGRPIGPDLAVEEVGPLSDDPFPSNRIAAAVSQARDAFLIIKHLNAGKSVLVVFGGSHLMIHRPALDAALGGPCHASESLEAAAARCRPGG